MEHGVVPASKNGERLPAWKWTVEAQATSLPASTWIVSSLLAIVSLRTANSLLTAAAIMCVPIILRLLWRPGEAPVLVFACCMQWLQASAAIFYTDYYGVSLEQSFGGLELDKASWLSLFAVLAQALGMRTALIGSRRGTLSTIAKQAKTIQLPKIFLLYVLAFGLSGVIHWLAFSVPVLTQALLPLGALKWVFVFLLTYCAIVQKRHYALVALVTLLEFVTGFLGQFSSFKSVFYVVVVAVLASPLALRRRSLATIVAIVMLLFVSGVCWTAIKQDYRQFLSESVTSEGEVPAIEQRVTKVGELLSALTWQNLQDGLDALILRISYVNYFALSIRNVPSQVPYENGALWLEAIEHVALPRLIYPSKPPLYDSERTMMYTGMQVAGVQESTSIGIGYVGESYIDFGPTGMFAPIFALGVVYGLIYRLFALQSRLPLLGCGIATAILVFGACTIETSSAKLLGGNLSASLVLGVVYHLLGRPFEDWTRARRN